MDATIPPENDREVYDEILFQCRTLVDRDDTGRHPLDISLDGFSPKSMGAEVLLSSVAWVATQQREDIAAAAAVTVKEEDHVHTTIYIAYNGQPPQRALQHIYDIILKLKSAPKPEDVKQAPPESAVKNSVRDTFLDLAALLYRFSWKRWEYYAKKRRETLRDEVLPALETPAAMEFFSKKELDALVKVLSRQISRLPDEDDPEGVARIMNLLYNSWRKKGYFAPTDAEAKVKVGAPRETLFAKAQRFMKDRDCYFPLPRWVAKLMSFHVHCCILFRLAHSNDLQPLLRGNAKFTVRILDSPAPPPRCDVDVSEQTIALVVNSIRKQFRAERLGPLMTLDSPELDKDVSSFTAAIYSKFAQDTRQTYRDDKAKHLRRNVHAELAVLAHLHQHAISAFPYMGVSKLSCTACQHYLCAYARHGGRGLSTQVSHKHRPGWDPPTLGDADLEDKIMTDVLRHMQESLKEHLVRYIRTVRHSPAAPSSYISQIVAPNDELDDRLVADYDMDDESE